MVSVRTLYQSAMMLSVSYWIRNSTPFLVFSWGGEEGDAVHPDCYLIHTEFPSADGVSSANEPLKHSFCWICLSWPSKQSLLSGPPWTLGQSGWFCSEWNIKVSVTFHYVQFLTFRLSCPSLHRRVSDKVSKANSEASSSTWANTEVHQRWLQALLRRTDAPGAADLGSLWKVSTPPWRTVHVWFQFFLKE